MRRNRRACGLALALTVAAAGCAPGRPGDDGRVTVAVSTEILADLARNVGGDRVAVETVVPAGGDPHSYEPTPADAAKVARADAAFTNHLLLEEHALIKLFDNNVPDGAPNISLAESAEQYGATLIPLVEDVGLDVLWLGLAVRGKGPSRSADIRLSATKMTGPGEFALYLTDALGQPQVYIDSTDGLDARDVAVLPPDAHTHLNWAFSQPGEYRLTLSAQVDAGDGSPARQLGSGTFAFAVGVAPQTLLRDGRTRLLDAGHADLAVDLDTAQVFARTDEQGDIPADQVVIDVPNRAIEEVPDDERFAFVGTPGSRVWQLPQAVLGKHVHGEIDPHLWQDVRNAKAYVQVIADTLAEVDPDGRDTYQANRDRYLRELSELHDYVRAQLAKLPPDRRQLITTHDAFGYLAKAYGMTIAGFVVPNPAQEPSAAQVTKLSETVRNLQVPAVFIEPNLAARASVLRRVATDQGVDICLVYGDAFDANAKTYVAMMRHNADELLRCLGRTR
ncbi:anchored repeat ABC transporter, substrate-binding protein [Micromonospora deserti]|uniref:Anchored repeat ABC transporter, substrate-binding protein n=1 Tax=Micromonospora deserti TaxID=2070366 RepID=A0A2W2D8R4_9ACTN|nr:anchored repeat ABC transporter, substrate-binding protein [Micromonospora deserti]PZG01755.1 anchored repeat ABC transporter, substrate-binding protein [Micromonospora deserti]